MLSFFRVKLAFFSISKLRLEMEAGKNDPHALRILALREDSNFLLVTILWANVALNVLLALDDLPLADEGEVIEPR